MSQIFQWVKNITYYLIFISMISNLMPSGKYERYIRLFSGAVFLLLTVSPLISGLNLEGKLAYAYEMLLFRQDTSEFQNQLYEMEQEQTRQIINQYEKAAAQDVIAMAEGEGFVCEEANVQIEANSDRERYGQITGIWLVLKRNEPQNLSAGDEREVSDQSDEEAEEEIIEKPEKTKEIRIQVVIGDDREGSRTVNLHAPAADAPPCDESMAAHLEYLNGCRLFGGETFTVSTNERISQMTAGEREVLDGFQRKVAGIYGLEETDIRITWKDD